MAALTASHLYALEHEMEGFLEKSVSRPEWKAAITDAGVRTKDESTHRRGAGAKEKLN